jgi:uncharacterized damage-inducible protein DinB
MTDTTATGGTPAEGGTRADGPALSQERQDLLALLDRHRHFLRATVRDLDDDQANRRTTASELTLATLIKHVSATEAGWTAFIVDGPSAIGGWDQDTIERHADQFRINEGDSLAELLARYDAVAARTAELVRTVDLDGTQPLPEAPWFPPGARWTARHVFIHIIAETSQHAGHADIIRESLDGAKTMG